MSAGFTPGPWEAIPASNRVMCPGRGVVARVENPWNDEKERQANTRLIGAAPRLYRELEAAGAIFRAYEALHLEKGTADGIEKAKRNATFAEIIEGLLAEVRGDV